AADRRRRARAGDDVEPARPALDLRSRAGGRRPVSGRAPAPAWTRPGDERGGAGRARRRRPRRLPALHRPRLPRRTGAPVAAVAEAFALAGIMGGLETEIGEETTDVLLEAANFEPIGILQTSERLGLRTEGSNRWEKGVDPYLAEQAAVLATELIVEVAGA